jgi:type IV pilus assembly protein PilV
MEYDRQIDILGNEKQKGFTLLEVIIAISILTVGILAMASLQGSAIIANASATDITDATTLASDRLEKLASLAYDDTDLNDTDGDGATGLIDTGFDSDPLTVNDADYGIIQQTARGKTYSVYWNIAEDDPKVGTKMIQVVVAWEDHGRAKQLALRHIKPHI